MIGKSPSAPSSVQFFILPRAHQVAATTFLAGAAKTACKSPKDKMKARNID